MKTPADIETASLADCIAGFRSKDLSARDLAEWAIANHEAQARPSMPTKHGRPIIFAFRPMPRMQPLRQASISGRCREFPSRSGPVRVSDYPIFAGCPRELPESWQVDGPVVRAIRQQLGVISGKTHTVQFAFGGLGVNPHWGPPRNPWDAEDHRSPGGSSSGAGVSLHEGSALLAIGTDTAGSVRMPATMTGNARFRPTPGAGPPTGLSRW